MTEPISLPSYWHHTAPHPPSASHLPSHADVVVIGGGLLGAATCYWLARAKVSVVLLEQTAFAAGATGRNGGFVSIGPAEAYSQAITHFGHETAQAVLKVTRENRALVRQVIAEEGIACDYREPGHLHLALDEEQLSTLAHSSLVLQQDGVPTTLLAREQVQEYIQTPLGPRILGGLFTPEMGLVHPVKLVQGFTAAAQRSGAHMVTTTALHLSPDGENVRIQTTQGTINAENVIVATNAWISELLPQMKKLVISVRGQVLAYHPLPPLFSPGIGADLSGSGEYWQQTPDGSIVLGGCRTVAEHHDRGVHVSQPTPSVQNALEQVFPQLFPHLMGLRVARRWAGLMAFTPDLLPIADRIPDLPNTWVVGGFSGHGMPFGLRLGQLLAEAVTTSHPPEALHPFQIDRPTLKHL